MKRLDQSKQRTSKTSVSDAKKQSVPGEKYSKKFKLPLKKYLPILIAILIIISGSVLFWPVDRTETLTRQVNFSTNYTSNTDRELGDTAVTQEGKPGTRIATYSIRTSLFKLLWGIEGRREEVSSKTTVTPTEKIISKGTVKYQYMLCSDGSYRYYNDEQFKDPAVGFTSKSEDFCAKFKQGTKTRLADDATGGLHQNPNNQTNLRTAYLPTDSSCRKTDIVKYKTVTRNDANLAQGVRQTVSAGDDGYTFVCPSMNLSNIVPPMDEIVYVGTGETARLKAEADLLRSQQEAIQQRNLAIQQWQSCAQSVRSQVAAINGGDPTPAIDQLCGRAP